MAGDGLRDLRRRHPARLGTRPLPLPEHLHRGGPLPLPGDVGAGHRHGVRDRRVQARFRADRIVDGAPGSRRAESAAGWPRRNTTTLFNHALQVNPKSWISNVNVGSGLEEQGRLEEAIAHYRVFLANAPASERRVAHYDLAVTLGKLNRNDEAIAHLRAALRIAPDYAEAHNELGHMLFLKGHLDSAIVEMREVVRLQPANARAQGILGQVLRASGITPPELLMSLMTHFGTISIFPR